MEQRKLQVVPHDGDTSVRDWMTDDDLIRLEGIGKVYRGRGRLTKAIEDVSVGFGRGEFVSVVGPSGCGKSTLMMVTAGLQSASAGRVVIHGREIRAPYTDAGIVFQSDVLLDWRTVVGNVMLQGEVRKLPVDDCRQRANALLASVGLAGFERSRPFELSGGMRQRVAICRALLHDPDVLLMDEPFGALDALTREKMNVDLQSIWMQTAKTVMFITHDISEAVFLSDRVVVMTPRPGRVQAVVDINMPRPRSPDVRETSEFAEATAHIHDLLKRLGVFD